jgi:hypothetical protein
MTAVTPEKRIIAVVGATGAQGLRIPCLRGSSVRHPLMILETLYLSGSCWNQFFDSWNPFDKIEVRNFTFLI